jgi:hypothetical protein
VNILSGESYIPPVYNINNADYYGAGYCLKHISDLTGGIYMSRHMETWEYIGSVLGQKVHFQYETFRMNLYADGNEVTNKIYGILPSITNFDRAQFFTGKTPNADSIRLSFEVKYKGFDSTYTNSSTMYPQKNNETKDIALRTMYENEVLKEMFLQIPLDTLAITKYAVAHRILNDFTSFIALEPSDTIPFITDPNDETNYWTTDVVKKQNVVKNPFIFSVLKENNQIKFTFQTGMSGTVVLKIFNLLGRTVYSKTIQSGANQTQHTICRNGDLGKGTYIAVAKFVYRDKNRSTITKQKIVKFTVVN